MTAPTPLKFVGASGRTIQLARSSGSIVAVELSRAEALNLIASLALAVLREGPR